MMRMLALASLVFVVDGGRYPIPRDLLCLTTARGQPITLHLRGDRVFTDGFESGSPAIWLHPPGPCDG